MTLSRKDLLAEARSRFIEQLKGKANWDSLVSVFTTQIQALEDAALEVLSIVTITGSSGEQLDGLGRILKEPRNGRSDTAYRTRLTAKAHIISSQGTIEDVLGLLALVTQDIAEVRELFPASFIADVGQTQEPGEIAPLVKLSRPVAIGGALEYSRTLDADAFTWADDHNYNMLPREVANGHEENVDTSFPDNNWGGGTAFGRDTSRFHSGASSVEWVEPDVGNFFETPHIKVEGGQEYVASLWHSADAVGFSSKMKVEFIWVAQFTSGVIATAYFTTSGFDSWYRTDLRGFVPANALTCYMKLTVPVSFGLVSDVWMDDWQIEPATPCINLFTPNQRTGGNNQLDTSGFTTNGSLTVSSAIGAAPGSDANARTLKLPAAPGVYLQTDARPCDPSTAYVVQFIMKTSDDNQAATLELTTDSGVVTSQSITNFDIADGWKLFTITGTTQSDATEIWIKLTWSTTTAFDAIYYGNFQLELGSVASTFQPFDARDWIEPDWPQIDSRRGFPAFDDWQDETDGSTRARAVAHDGVGLYVRVGDGGLIQTSPDGETWTTRTSGTAVDLYGVAHGNGLWIAVGNSGVLRTSPTGTTWTNHDVGGANLRAIAYANGLWMAVGASGKFWRSPTGTADWSGSTIAGVELLGIAEGAGTWLIVGATGTILRSVDLGLNWVTRTSGTSEHLRGVAFGLAVWVVVGDTATVLRSINDGGTWAAASLVSDLTTKDLNAVRHNGRGVFTATGEDATIAQSVNGDEWSTVSVDSVTDDQRGVAADHLNTWLTVGDAGTVLREYDGGSWIGVLEA